jgi:ATP-binding cassette subfamily B (MDR/TAP) protein 1
MYQAFVSAFVHAPKLAGVLFALIPFTMVMFTALGYWSESVAVTKGPMDGKTSSFIEQILSSVRIVQSFDMAPKLLRKLQTGMLGPLKKLSTKTSATRALEQAAAYGAGFLVYSLSFWYGGISVQGGLSVGNFLTVSCSLMAQIYC